MFLICLLFTIASSFADGLPSLGDLEAKAAELDKAMKGMKKGTVRAIQLVSPPSQMVTDQNGEQIELTTTITNAGTSHRTADGRSCTMTGPSGGASIVYNCSGSKVTVPRRKVPEKPTRKPTSKRNDSKRSSSRSTENKNQSGKSQNGGQKNSGGEKYQPKPVGSGPQGQGLDTSSAANSAARQCPFDAGQKFRSEYDRLNRECRSFSEQTQKACDAENSKTIIAAMEESKKAARQVAMSQSKSAIAACDRFGNATKKLQEALDSYRTSCEPIKEKCEDACHGASKTAGNMDSVLGGNPACHQNALAMADHVQSEGKHAISNLRTCGSFNKPLAQAFNDAQALLSANPTGNKCEKLFAESCDPGNPDCLSPEVKELGSLFTAGKNSGAGSAKGTKTLKNRIEAVTGNGDKESFYSFQGSQQNRGVNAAVGAKSATGRKLDEGQRGAGAVGAHGKRGSGFHKFRRKKKSKGYSFGGGYKSRKNRGRNAASLQANGKRNGKGLQDYLPGGRKDPNSVGFIHGITSALGPSIFEKVSNRYQIYEPRLLKNIPGD